MLKKLICAGLLATSSVAAQASVIDMYFKYTGFQVDSNRYHGYDPKSTLVGHFSGEDSDNNGVLEAAELSALSEGGTDFMGCWSPVMHCSVSSFSYSQGMLQFSASRSYYDEFSADRHEIVTGSFSREYSYRPNSETYLTQTWTPETTLTMSAQPEIPPVPEPGTYAMLMLGLLGVAGLQARRQ